MGKNARKFYYPMRQAIESILPLVDEFVVALGDSDEDDTTRAEIWKPSEVQKLGLSIRFGTLRSTPAEWSMLTRPTLP